MSHQAQTGGALTDCVGVQLVIAAITVGSHQDGRFPTLIHALITLRRAEKQNIVRMHSPQIGRAFRGKITVAPQAGISRAVNSHFRPF